MMYELTLTFDERRAIDWIGHRYFHGDDLYELLSDCYDGEVVWDDPEDITFAIPEHVAWEIRDGIGALECFNDELKFKFLVFCDEVV